MDFQRRFVGSLSDFGPGGDDVRLRRDDLLLRFLVCDTVILKTTRLLELRALAEMLGADGLVSVLKSGRLRFTCEAFAPAFRSPADAVDENDFLFVCVWEGDPPTYVRTCLANALRASVPELANLADEIPQYIAEAPGQAESDRILAQLRQVLLEGHPEFRSAIAASFLRETGRAVDPRQITVAVRARPTGGFRLSTNLSRISGVSRAQLHTAVGRGASSFASAHARLEEMQRHHAIPGAPSDAVAVLAEHVDFVESLVSPDRQAGRLRRVIEVRGIPLLSDGMTVDAGKLLDLIKSAECQEFRDWLRRTESLTDAEIRDQLSSLVSRLGLFVRSPAGKTLRLLVSIGAGMVTQNLAAGAALGFLDTFVLEKVLPVRGPIGFVDELTRITKAR